MQESLSSFPPAEPLVGKLLVASSTLEDPILSRSVSLIVHQDSENVFAVLLNRPMTPPPGLAKMLHPTSGDVPTAGDGSSQRSPTPDDSQARSSPTRWGMSAESPSGEVPQEVSPDEVPADASLPTAQGSSGTTSMLGPLGTIHFGGPLSGPVVAVHGSSEHAEAEAGRGVYVAAAREHLEQLVKDKPAAFRLIVGHLGWTVDHLTQERQAGYWHVIDATDTIVFRGDQELWPSLIRKATTDSMTRWLGLSDGAPRLPECN